MSFKQIIERAIRWAALVDAAKAWRDGPVTSTGRKLVDLNELVHVDDVAKWLEEQADKQ